MIGAGLLFGFAFRNLGLTFLIVAVLAWLVTICGYLYAEGKLDGLARIQPIGTALNLLIGAGVPSLKPTSASPTTNLPPASAPRQKERTKEEREAIADAAGRKLERLLGIDGVKVELNKLIKAGEAAHNRGDTGFGVAALATVIILAGARGSGKSTVADLLSPLLYGLGITQREEPFKLRKAQLGGVTGAALSQSIEEAARAATNGILLIDDADWLFETSQGSSQLPASDFGHGLISATEKAPGKTVVVLCGSEAAMTRLRTDPDQAFWTGKMHINLVKFPNLPEDDLLAILDGSLAAKNLKLDDGAKGTFKSELKQLTKRLGANFDNAIAARRFADHLILHASTAQDGGSGRRTITAADVRAVAEQQA